MFDASGNFKCCFYTAKNAGKLFLADWNENSEHSKNNSKCDKNSFIK